MRLSSFVVCHVQRVYFTSIRAKTHLFFWEFSGQGICSQAGEMLLIDDGQWCIHPHTRNLIVIELDITRLCVAHRYWWHLWLWRIWWWQRYQTRNNRKLWWLYSTLDSHWVGHWQAVLASHKLCVRAERAERAGRGMVILHKVGVLMIPAVLDKLQVKK